MTSLRQKNLWNTQLGTAVGSFLAGLAVMGCVWVVVGSRVPAPVPSYQPPPPILASRSPPTHQDLTVAGDPDMVTAVPVASDQPSIPASVLSASENEATPRDSGSDPAPVTLRDLSPPVPLRINVNTATQRELELLPGIGPALSQRIIDERARGRFRSLSDLDRVRGIGPRTLERLDGLVVFE